MKQFGYIRLFAIVAITFGLLCFVFYNSSEPNSTYRRIGPVKKFTAWTSWLANLKLSRNTPTTVKPPGVVTQLPSSVNFSRNASSPLKLKPPGVVKQLPSSSRNASSPLKLKPPGVVAYLKGGLGNQLFKVATTYAIARQLNVPLFLVIPGDRKDAKNLSNTLRNPRARAYALDAFELTSSKIDLDVISSKTWDPVKTRAKKENRFSGYPCSNFFFERISKTEAANNFIYLEDYCHSEKFFEDYAPEVKKLLTFKQSYLNSTSKQFLQWKGKIRRARGNGSTSAAIHIRRGDYLPNRHWATPTSFHEEAVSKMVEKYCEEKVTFFLFSDDIEYVKVKDKFKTFYQPTKKSGKMKNCTNVPDFIYVSENFKSAKPNQGLTSLEEFILMTLCENIIISNSSFSWWAAYLNSNPNKTVIGPTFHKNFYDRLGNTNNRMFMSLMLSFKYPKNWITLDPYNGTGL